MYLGGSPTVRVHAVLQARSGPPALRRALRDGMMAAEVHCRSAGASMGAALGVELLTAAGARLYAGVWSRRDVLLWLYTPWDSNPEPAD